MFWTIVGAILFITVGIPLLVYIAGIIIALIAIALESPEKPKNAPNLNESDKV